MHAWTWTYEGYDPETERLRETLCTLGNGLFATRGAASETDAGPTHYPGTYAAGCYDRLTSTVAGHRTENEDMVNLPNWLPLRYRVRPAGAPPGPWLSPGSAELAEHRQTLHLRHGTLTRRSVYALDGGGRRLHVAEQRIVHMGDPHLAAQRTSFTAEGWAGEVEVESGLDGDVRNTGVARYHDLADRHLADWRTGQEADDTVWLRCRTISSDIRVAVAARTRAVGHRAVPSRISLTEQWASRTLTVPVADGETVTVDKTVALHTSRDPAISGPRQAAVAAVRRAAGFPGCSPRTTGPGSACGGGRNWTCQEKRAASCACTCSTSFRRSPRTRPNWMSESPPGDSTGRHTGDMSSGTNCSSSPT